MRFELALVTLLLPPLLPAQGGVLVGPGGPKGPYSGIIASEDWRKELAPLVGSFRGTGTGRRQGFEARPWHARSVTRWVLGDSVLRQELVVEVEGGPTMRWVLWFADDADGEGAGVTVFGDDGTVAGPASVVRGDPEASMPSAPGMGSQPPIPDLRCAVSLQPAAVDALQFGRLAWFLDEDGYELDFARMRFDGFLRYEGRGRFVRDASVSLDSYDGEAAIEPAPMMERLAGWEGRYQMSGGFIPAGLGFARREGSAVARSVLSGHVLQIDETFREAGPVRLSRVFAWDAAIGQLRCVTFRTGGSVEDLRLRTEGEDRWVALGRSADGCDYTTVICSEGQLREIRRKTMSGLGAVVQTEGSVYSLEGRAPR